MNECSCCHLKETGLGARQPRSSGENFWHNSYSNYLKYFEEVQLVVVVEQEAGCFTQRFWLCKQVSLLTTLAGFKTYKNFVVRLAIKDYSEEKNTPIPRDFSVLNWFIT
jgi:hypothetical protein